MKHKLLFTSVLILFFLGFNVYSSGQPLSKGNLKTIINGKIWVPKTSLTQGKQFFLERMDLKGSIQFKGVQFDHIEFAYDISTEEVITAIETNDKTKRNIVINPYLLEGFSVMDSSVKYNFVRGDFLHFKLDSSGYYQVVRFPNIQYIIKRRKHKKLKLDHSQKFEYITHNELFILKNNELITVKSKSDILNLFPNKKKEMKRFIRNNRLKIGTKKPMDAIALLTIFDL
ncbi:hypothetical protein DWB61_12960 [Ancylomarina euxinus]|uniref:Uncharacterized protein n=1 Tax=Ancylomarina euxinus TaxID=2283627 RepID=A0A425XYZ8_9BACT|nr:hypothetical protein [Ancylomarina euxinus]MCZ4695689.1 hypothetical protein [Ancylomarina euxinus]MUP16007.1 hypothetical protein [Ancylomarina euxinus]RRG20253.1 hypothetical protein DWB61_12960 [Ancylomarina euxinus]